MIFIQLDFKEEMLPYQIYWILLHHIMYQLYQILNSQELWYLIKLVNQ